MKPSLAPITVVLASAPIKTSIRFLVRKSLVLALLCATAATAHSGEAQTESKAVELPAADLKAHPWQFSLAVPGWLANTSGTVGLKGIDSDVYLSADTLLRHTDMIASISAGARYNRFGIYGDLLYVSASDGVGGNGLVKKLDVRLDEYLADMELNFRLLEGRHGWLDLRGGVRYTNIYTKLSITPDDGAIDRASARFVDLLSGRLRDALKNDLLRVLNGKDPVLPIPPLGAQEKEKLLKLIEAARQDPELRAAIKSGVQSKIDSAKGRVQKKISDFLKKNLNNSFSLAEDWWDPYVGLGARYNLGGAFYLTAKGDIGGFGVGSELSWQASGALGCQLTRNIFTEVGYRYLYTDYNRNGFLYKVSMSGVQITTGVTF